jgi:hypothetical protein
VATTSVASSASMEALIKEVVWNYEFIGYHRQFYTRIGFGIINSIGNAILCISIKFGYGGGNLQQLQVKW